MSIFNEESLSKYIDKDELLKLYDTDVEKCRDKVGKDNLIIDFMFDCFTVHCPRECDNEFTMPSRCIHCQSKLVQEFKEQHSSEEIEQMIEEKRCNVSPIQITMDLCRNHEERRKNRENTDLDEYIDEMTFECRKVTGFDINSNVTNKDGKFYFYCPYAKYSNEELHKKLGFSHKNIVNLRCIDCVGKVACELRDKMTKYMK